MHEALNLAGGILLLAFSAAGWGALGLRLLGGRAARDQTASAPGPLDCGVFGLAVVYLLGASLSLTVGIPDVASDLATGIGLLAVIAAIRGSWWERRASAVGLLLALTLALGMALGVLKTPVNYDTGLYHLQQIEWMRSGPLPFGLANLHDRFGYNSSWLTVAALGGGTRLVPDATYLLNATALVLVVGALLARARARLLVGHRGFSTQLMVTIPIVLIASARETMFSWFGLSPSSDVPAALLSLYAAASLAVLIEDHRGERGVVGIPSWQLAAGALTGAFAMTVKLLQAPVAVASALWFVLRVRRTRAPVRQIWIRAALPAAAVGLLWIGQNLTISGCVVDPVPSTCSSMLPWSVDAASIAEDAWVVRAWARAPGEDFLVAADRSDWYRLWWERMLPHRPFAIQLLAGSGVLAAALGVYFLTPIRRRSRDGGGAAFAWISSLSLAGLVFAFAVAPDPRFVLAFLVLLPASLLARFAPAVRDASPSRSSRVAAGAVLLVPLLVSIPLSRADDPARARWRSPPKTRFEVQRTNSGMELYVPTVNEQCWAGPMPCTPEFDADLELRRILGRKAFVLAARR